METVKEMLYKFSLLIVDAFVFFIYNISFILLPITKIFVKKALRDCGVEVNGNQDFDPKVNNDRFYSEVVSRGFAGFGFAYARNCFDCADLFKLNQKLYTVQNIKKFRFHPYSYLHSLISKYLFVQTERNIKEVASSYEGEDNIFGASVEPERYLTISTGVWKDSSDLDDSYRNKFDLIARMLKLKSGMSILDVGCGEGTLCKYFADNHDGKVVGINVAREQIKKARELCNGLNVEIKEVSALRVRGIFDRIVCVQAVEHFGYSNLRPFFERMNRCLTNDGFLFLELSLISDSMFPHFDGYLNSFYTAFFPLNSQFCEAIDGLFVIENWKNVSYQMYLTCKAEMQRKTENKEQLESVYGKKLFRSFEAIFSIFAALQRNQWINLSFVVLSKSGVSKDYDVDV